MYPKTKISIVVATRNDNYGGTLINRFTNFIYQFIAIEKNYPNLFELVIVDWNSDPNNLPLEKIYNFSLINNYKIIKYDHEYHKRISNNSKIPFFEYIAKNHGIESASSDFVITCTQDVIFSKNLLDYLYELDIDKNSFYRVDRYDFNIVNDFQINQDLDVSEDFFNKNNNIIQSRQSLLLTIINGVYKRFRNRDLIFKASDRLKFEKIHNEEIILSYDNNFLKPNSILEKIYFYLFNNKDKNDLFFFILRVYSLIFFYLTRYKYIHKLCSCDFILTYKKNFINSGAFLHKIGPQLHIDSLACFQLYKLGLNQVILKNKKLYHQNHATDDQDIRNTYHSSIFLRDLLIYMKN